MKTAGRTFKEGSAGSEMMLKMKTPVSDPDIGYAAGVFVQDDLLLGGFPFTKG
jgi:hypothetical protein